MLVWNEPPCYKTIIQTVHTGLQVADSSGDLLTKSKNPFALGGKAFLVVSLTSVKREGQASAFFWISLDLLKFLQNFLQNFGFH